MEPPQYDATTTLGKLGNYGGVGPLEVLGLEHCSSIRRKVEELEIRKQQFWSMALVIFQVRGYKEQIPVCLQETFLIFKQHTLSECVNHNYVVLLSAASRYLRSPWAIQNASCFHDLTSPSPSRGTSKRSRQRRKP